MSGFFARLQTEIMAKLKKDAETSIKTFMNENKAIFINNLAKGLPGLSSDIASILNQMEDLEDKYKYHE